MSEILLALFAGTGWLFSLFLLAYIARQSEPTSEPLPNPDTHCTHGLSKLKFCRDCAAADPMLKEPVSIADPVGGGAVVQVTPTNRLLMKCPQCQKEYESPWGAGGVIQPNIYTNPMWIIPMGKGNASW